MLKDEEAEAVRIQDGKHSWLVVLNHLETGADANTSARKVDTAWDGSWSATKRKGKAG